MFKIYAIPSIMGRKRKANTSRTDKAQSPDEEGSRRIINTYEDVADSEDEFFINRDKILLEEGPNQKRQRRLQEEGTREMSFCAVLKRFINVNVRSFL